MPVILRTFRRFDVRRFSKNLFPLGLHCQRVPKAVVRIFGQSLFFRYLVESPGTPKIVKRIRRQAGIVKINGKSILTIYPKRLNNSTLLLEFRMALTPYR